MPPTSEPHSQSSVLNLSFEEVAAVVDQSPDCVMLISLDGRLTYVNASGQAAMEIDDLSNVIGRLWIDFWPADVRASLSAALNIASDGSTARIEASRATTFGAVRWWNILVSPIRNAAGAVSSYASFVRDVTEAELTRQALETTTAEMRHRLKNSYAMVGSLLSAFARGVPEREAFAHDMIERLSALGTAQTLFASRDHAPCEISELIPALVRAFNRPDCPVTIETISQTQVDQGQADAIALVLGELAVNSAKHGALGSAGSIIINVWSAEGMLHITWRERSNREVHAHRRDGGQGLRLMERIVKARKGIFSLDWQSDGLDVELTLELPRTPILRRVDI